MSTTTDRTNLTMSMATFDELYIRAQVPQPAQERDARALRRALTASEVIAGRVHVACCPAALRFVREAAPEIARRWPAVFGDVDVPRAATISQVCGAIGQTVAGIESDGDSLRLVFESGDALLIGVDGALDWRGA